MKLKPITKEYTLRGETITIKSIPAIEVAKIANLTQKEDFKNPEKQIPIFSELIYNYTSLGEENTKDEIELFLSLQELVELGTVIMGVEDKVENFT